MQLTAIFVAVTDGYIGFLAEVPGTNTQGRTLGEARQNLKEAAAMVLEANRELCERLIAGQPVIRESFELSA